jgi:hypothetical protein
MTKIEKTFEDVYQIDFKSMDLQDLKLYYCYRTFIVEHNDKMVLVNRSNMDERLRYVTQTKLQNMLKEGYVTLVKTDLDKYYLRFNYGNSK